MKQCVYQVVSILAILAAVVGVGAEGAAAQANPAVAPSTTTSADGLTTTDGVRTLTTSQASGLDPAGQAVAVAGSGYDTGKGIYVALCVIPPRNSVPTPCGGGVDTEGSAGASNWFSSNPPDYGVGLAQPYGPSGSFSTRFNVRPEIAPGIDCRQVRCALVTRSDHTRTSDRSQDIFIPVSFRADPGSGATPTTPAPGQPATPAPVQPTPGPEAPADTTTTEPMVVVPDTVAPPPPVSSAPDATVSDDGTEATDGHRTVRVSDVADLDPGKVELTVTGQGFDEAAGIYVALCAVSDDRTAAPGPCTAGGDASAWISSTAPDHSAHLATPYDEGGKFEVDLTVGAVIDDETDCREQACAVVARYDDERPDDRTGDLAVPVSFAAESAPSTTTTAAVPAAAADDEDEAAAVGESDSGGRSAMPVVVGLGLLGLGLAGALAARARHARSRTPGPEAVTS